MKLPAIITVIALFAAQGFTINYIGMSKPDIIKAMQKNSPGFDYDDGAVNKTYNYLKFVDRFNEETWLFFLSPDNICTHTKLMSDYSNLKIRTDELNKQYKKAGENIWTGSNKGITYTIELKKEEWFFSILMKQKK
jgi:hypothetical protein